MKRIPGHSYDTPSGHKALDCFHSKDFSIDESRMTATGVLAAASRDRVGDIIEIAGIQTANHKRNPISLWDHGWRLSMPIGIDEDEAGNYLVLKDLDRGLLISTTVFSQHLLEAEQIFHLIAEGMIRAKSIGYRTIKAESMQEDGRFVGYHLQEIELLEDTWCALPCNQDAIMATLSKNVVCGKSLSPTIRRALMPFAGARKAWSPGGKAVDDGPPANGEDEETPASSAAEDLENVGQALHRAVYRAYKEIGEMCAKAMPVLEETEHYPFAATHHDEAGNLMNRVDTSWEASWPDLGSLADEPEEETTNDYPDRPEGNYIDSDVDELDDEEKHLAQKLMHRLRVHANAAYHEKYLSHAHPIRVPAPSQGQNVSPFCS